MRGGVAYGRMFFDPRNPLIAGDTFVKAVELEKLAKFPRFILDNQLVKLFNFETTSEFINKINCFPSKAEFKMKGPVLFNTIVSFDGSAKKFVSDNHWL